MNIKSATHPVWVDDDHLAFLTDISGVPQVWKVAASGGRTEQLTSYDQRVAALYRLPAGLGLAFAMDAGGNEHNQIFQLPLDGQEARNLTNNPAAVHQFGGMTENGQMVFASNSRKYGHFDIYRLSLDSGNQELLLQNEDHYNIPAALSPDGRHLLYNKLKAQSDNALWMLDLLSGASRPIMEDASNVPATYVRPVWNNDSTGFYLLTDRDSQFIYLAFYSLEERRLRTVHQENWDLERVALSADGRYLALTVNEDGYSVLKVKDLWDGPDGSLVALPAMPRGVINGAVPMNWSPSGHRLAFAFSSGARPADIWVLDVDQGEVRQVTFSRGEAIAADGFVEPELVRFRSFDGLQVPFWLFRPPGAKPTEPLPTVVRVHGGPEGQERPAFNPVVQFLVNQGFAVVAPNVRGSTGYGSDYHHLDDVERRMDSVHDVAALVEFLVEEGIADAGRVSVMGASYGGFMTLASITHYPELWAAAVDIVGIANFETFMENTSAYRRAHRASEYGSLEQHRDLLRRISPIHYVDRIKCPLMVIHGANDPRVPVGEAEQIVASLRQRQHPVSYLRYEDEGHGIVRLANKLHCYPQVAAFLHEHLGTQ